MSDPLSEIIRPWMEDPVCCPTMALRWDQWAVATFTCKCGSYRGTSAGQSDMLTAIAHGYRKFLINHGDAYRKHLIDRGIDLPEDDTNR